VRSILAVFVAGIFAFCWLQELGVDMIEKIKSWYNDLPTDKVHKLMSYVYTGISIVLAILVGIVITVCEFIGYWVLQGWEIVKEAVRRD